MNKVITARFRSYFPPVRTEESDVEYGIWASYLPHLVEMKILLDGSADRPYYDEMMSEARHDIVGFLWIHNLWRGPWQTLVNAEFPGREPTDEDIFEFISQHVSESEADKRQVQSFKGIFTTLAEQGSYIDETDLILVNLLSRRLAARRLSRLSAQNLVSSRAVWPQDPAWEVVLSRFFVDP